MSEKTADPLHPSIEPYAHGMLPVGDGHELYWETCGDPGGTPALVVHGGPGSGCGPMARRLFDPRRYRTVLFDQRGAGRSTPHASDPDASLEHNTTEHLVADMERLRVHLGVDSWVLFGGSWGSTLILAYAERHPERVRGIVLNGVTTTRRSEIDWLYRGARLFYPREWARFLEAAGPDADEKQLPAAYDRLVNDPDPAVRLRAADEWCRWEDAVLSGEPGGSQGVFSDREEAARLAVVRICAHYFSRGAWLEEGQLLCEAHRLAGIPGVLVHGRVDICSPLGTAWELSQVWPDAELVVVENSGHLGTDNSRREIMRALDRLAG